MKTNLSDAEERARYEAMMARHNHCWHYDRGAIMISPQVGEAVQKCCLCPETKIVHVEHAVSTSSPRVG